MKPIKYINKVKRKQLSNFNFSDDAKKMRNRREWKKNREQLILQVTQCEWCGEEPDNSFHIHHKQKKNLSRQWIKVSDEAFVNSESYEPCLTEDRKECPHCGLRDYNKRKTKTPDYICYNCSKGFDSLRCISGGEYIQRNYKQKSRYINDSYKDEKASWLKDNKEVVGKQFEQRYNRLLTEYIDIELEQVAIICQKCHYKEEKTKMRRCGSCSSNWYNPQKIRDNMCWECVVEENGLQLCSCCNDKWFQPSKYKKCSNCR